MRGQGEIHGALKKKLHIAWKKCLLYKYGPNPKFVLSRVCLGGSYPKGIESFSPGLRGTSYPGNEPHESRQP